MVRTTSSVRGLNLFSTRTASLLGQLFLLLPNVAVVYANNDVSDSNNFVLSTIAEYCVPSSPPKEECFPLRAIAQGDNDEASDASSGTDTSELGHVCLELLTNAGGGGSDETHMLLEVNYVAGLDWAIVDAHFWLGDSLHRAPIEMEYQHDSHLEEASTRSSEQDMTPTTVIQKMPDAARFTYHTDMQDVDDPRLHTTTVWNEVVHVGHKEVCLGSSEDDEAEPMRAFAAQAVLTNGDNTVTAFAAMQPGQMEFDSLESFFVICACDSMVPSGVTLDEAGATTSSPASESATSTHSSNMPKVEEEKQHVQEEKGVNSMLNNMKAQEEFEHAMEKEEEEMEEGESEEEYEEATVERTGDNLDNDSEDFDDDDDASSEEDDDAYDDDDSDSAEEEAEEVDYEYDDTDPVFVHAQELEVTTSFLVVMPNQKHYIDKLLDETNLHRTEEQIEASPELHDTWHLFVQRLMVDFQVPSIDSLANYDTAGGKLDPAYMESVQDHERRDYESSGGGVRRNRRSLSTKTTLLPMEWIEDSPDLYKFLITTPCPKYVLDDMAAQKKKQKKQAVDMGITPKDLVRKNDVEEDEEATEEPTCYKAFGKYKVLHLNPEELNIAPPPSTTSTNSTSMDDGEGDGDTVIAQDEASSRQEVCYTIFHMTRQALADERLGEDLPEDEVLPFLLRGGKPESCLATGITLMVPKPKDLPLLTKDMDDSKFRDNVDIHVVEKSALYELKNEDGTWNILRVMELVAYVTTSLLMMALFITIYCCFLPKIDLESRNRVTDDWSQPSLRPQRIVALSSQRGNCEVSMDYLENRNSKKSKRNEPEYFPWLE